MCACECGETEIRSKFEIKNLNKQEGHHCLVSRSSLKSIETCKNKTIQSQYDVHKSVIKKTPRKKHLDYNDWIQIVFNPCVYCGHTDIRGGCGVSRNKRHDAFFASQDSTRELRLYEVRMNGVDRVDSSLPYSKENCVSCCGMCNRMKGGNELNNFLLKVKQIHDYKNLSTVNDLQPASRLGLESL